MNGTTIDLEVAHALFSGIMAARSGGGVDAGSEPCSAAQIRVLEHRTALASRWYLWGHAWTPSGMIALGARRRGGYTVWWLCNGSEMRAEFSLDAGLDPVSAIVTAYDRGIEMGRRVGKLWGRRRAKKAQ